jgi:hypothetical protein
MAATLSCGSDYSTFRDDGSYGMTYRKIYGPRVPLEGVARAWLTSPGQLFWAPTFGYNAGRLLNAGIPAQTLRRLEPLLRTAAKQVDFVYDAAVTVTYIGNVLTVAGLITLADYGQHPLLLTASQAAAATVQFPTASLAPA